jgi:Kef-type K+ transport system membrane component KefB
MIPRGEVGLIFANEGTKLSVNGFPVIDPNVLSAVVIMVMITTLVTPPFLKWKYSRNGRRTPEC